MDRSPSGESRKGERASRLGVLRRVPPRVGTKGRTVSDLFDLERPLDSPSGLPSADTPLADRMRPRSLDEVEGPEEVVGSNGFLRRAIAEDRVPSMVLWGPPGVGKTTLARLIAAQTSSNFVSYSAVATGVKEMREVLEGARRARAR